MRRLRQASPGLAVGRFQLVSADSSGGGKHSLDGLGYRSEVVWRAGSFDRRDRFSLRIAAVAILSAHPVKRERERIASCHGLTRISTPLHSSPMA